MINRLSPSKAPNSSSKCFLESWHLLWGFNSPTVLKPKLHCHLQSSPPLDPIPRQLNPVHIPTSHIFQSYFTLTFNCWFPLHFPSQIQMMSPTFTPKINNTFPAHSHPSSYLVNHTQIKIYRTIILPVVLYGCETWSLTLWQERKLRVFENMVLRRIFGPRRDEVTGEWRRLHNEELNDL